MIDRNIAKLLSSHIVIYGVIDVVKIKMHKIIINFKKSFTSLVSELAI